MAEGGYLIPDVIIYKRYGLVGWICRIFHLKYGWIELHPFKDIVDLKRNIGEAVAPALQVFAACLHDLIKEQHIDSEGI